MKVHQVVIWIDLEYHSVEDTTGSLGSWHVIFFCHLQAPVGFHQLKNQHQTTSRRLSSRLIVRQDTTSWAPAGVKTPWATKVCGLLCGSLAGTVASHLDWVCRWTEQGGVNSISRGTKGCDMWRDLLRIASHCFAGHVQNDLGTVPKRWWSEMIRGYYLRCS